MPAFAAVILAPLFLEHDYLRAARLLQDLRRYRRARDDRGTDLRSLAADSQHLVKRNRRANLAGKPLDRNLVADADAVLFSACLYYCKHHLCRTNTIIGRSAASQRTRLRGRIRALILSLLASAKWRVD